MLYLMRETGGLIDLIQRKRCCGQSEQGFRPFDLRHCTSPHTVDKIKDCKRFFYLDELLIRYLYLDRSNGVVETGMACAVNICGWCSSMIRSIF